MTGASQTIFPGSADGSLVERDGEVVGSSLIGQDFKDRPQYFQSRPSATGYSGDATFFNNQGPNQRKLARQFERAAAAYLDREGPFTAGLELDDIPPDAVTTSASGIDPEISVENAEIQANRVASERELELSEVIDLVEDNTADPGLGFAGSPAVNVLELNLALDDLEGDA